MPLRKSIVVLAVLLAHCGRQRAVVTAPAQPAETSVAPAASLPIVATEAGTAQAATQTDLAPPPTAAFAAEGVLLGRRDGATVLRLVAKTLGREVPALTQVGPQRWWRQAGGAAAEQVWATTDFFRSEVLGSGVVVRLDERGCTISLAEDPSPAAAMPCEPGVAAMVQAQAALAVLARSDLEAMLQVETLAVTGTADRAVVAIGLIAAQWRVRALVRATAAGGLLEVVVAKHNTRVSFSGTQAFLQLDQRPAWRWHWGPEPPTTARTVLRVPVSGRDDPVLQWNVAAQLAGVVRAGPLAVRADWTGDDLQVRDVEAPVLSPLGTAGRAAVLADAIGVLALPTAVLINRASARAHLKAVTAGCLTMQVLDDVTSEKGVDGDSWVAVRRCSAARPLDH